MVLRPVRPSCPAGNSSPFGIWHLTHIPPICPAPRLVPSPQHRNFAGIDGSPMKDWLKIGQLCWTALWNHAVPPVFVQQIELSYVGSKKHQFLLWSSLLFEPSSIQKKKKLGFPCELLQSRLLPRQKNEDKSLWCFLLPFCEEPFLSTLFGIVLSFFWLIPLTCQAYQCMRVSQISASLFIDSAKLLRWPTCKRTCEDLWLVRVHFLTEFVSWQR